MKEKSIYTRRLGIAVAGRAKSFAGTGRYHVIPSQADKWGVVSEGSLRPFKAFTTKRAAVVFAKKTARSKQLGEVIIHSLDGKVLSTISL